MKGKYCLNFNCDTNCLDICINPYFVPIKVTIEYNVVSHDGARVTQWVR